MVITVDTNVIFSALYSKKGASHAILRLILEEKLKLAVSVPVYFEYYDVLSRKELMSKLPFTASELEDVLDLLALLAQKNSIYFLLRPNLPDEKDNIFVECAFASNSKYLITSNIKDFKMSELKGMAFSVVTPGEFIRNWRGKNE